MNKHKLLQYLQLLGYKHRRPDAVDNVFQLMTLSCQQLFVIDDCFETQPQTHILCCGWEKVVDHYCISQFQALPYPPPPLQGNPRHLTKSFAWREGSQWLMQIKTIFTYFSLINLSSPYEFVDIQWAN